MPIRAGQRRRSDQLRTVSKARDIGAGLNRNGRKQVDAASVVVTGFEGYAVVEGVVVTLPEVSMDGYSSARAFICVGVDEGSNRQYPKEKNDGSNGNDCPHGFEYLVSGIE